MLATTDSPAIALFVDDPSAATDVRDALEAGRFEVQLHQAPNAEGLPNAADLYVVEAGSSPEAALRHCRRLRAAAGEAFTPILYITSDAAPRARLACLEAGADAYLLRPFDPAELRAQVQALLRIKERHDALTTKSAEVERVNKRLQIANQQIDMELELARRIQESFLPRSLPDLPGLRFAVKYKPYARVGGDFYDVFRLDETHLGFYVADAMGHGVPASLLTVFVKKGVIAKEITGQDYRLVPPGEVLERLNRELIDQALSEKPFITMAYVLYDTAERTLQFARAGHPYPLYLPKDGPPQLWKIEGSLLGIFEIHYRPQTHALKPGDKLILYTDGMDAAAFADQPLGVPSLLAAAERHRDLAIGELVERLGLDLFGSTRQTDDLTILGMEVTG